MNLHTPVGLAMIALSISAAHAGPQAVPKVGSCPSGYVDSVQSCTPMSTTTQFAEVKKAECLPGWTQSGAYCLSPAPRRL